MPEGGQTGFGFDVIGRDSGSAARTGILTTPHGAVETPNFIFCATKAAIKGLTPLQMRELGAQIILSNTYHLMIQPGADVIEGQNGLHRFTGWDGPMLTDSGGFQIFSMGHGSVADEIKGRRNQASGGAGERQASLLNIDEEGATFRSYLDGSKIFLSPEKSIEIQRKLGADLIVQFDECTPFHVDKTYTANSMRLSHRWGDRSLAEFQRGDDGSQQLYGIVQGGVYPDLRRESSEYTRDREFFGTAIGGSLGAHRDQMMEVVSWCMPHLAADRPVHLLGIGGLIDILMAVKLGIDSFDCVAPTRIARHGWALHQGPSEPGNRINLRNARFRDDHRPLDENSDCPISGGYSRAYLHHLIRAGEPLGPILLSAHNVRTMMRLMQEIRRAIPNGGLDAVASAWLAEPSGKQADTDQTETVATIQ